MTTLMSETFNCALLDSGASKTVCGLDWFNIYLESLIENEKNYVSYNNSFSIYKFGSGKSVNAIFAAKIPIYIANEPIFLNVDVVAENIPLLFSKDSLKKANSKIDFITDSISIMDKNVDLVITNSGHYALPITKNSNIFHNKEKHNLEEFSNNVTLLANLSNKKSIAHKLHRQFAHPTSERLIDLLKSAGNPWNSDYELFELIKQINPNCDTCIKYRKPHPKPVTCIPLAKVFQDVLGMDLKFYTDLRNQKSHILLHIVDLATRFSASSIIPSKLPDVIIKNIMSNWIAVFGSPKIIFTDNGGEFANQHFLDMCETFNINVRVTAAQSPFSNGIVERHNATLAHILDKILEENDCDIKTALSWAVNAKNSLNNIHGFSSYQLAIGYNPNLPNNFNNLLPAATMEFSNKNILENIQNMHKARKAYIEAESNERIRRALRKQTRTSSEQELSIGDLVYFKYAKEKRLRGPGYILGFNDHEYIIKHGSYWHRIHRCNIIPAPKNKGDIDLQPLPPEMEVINEKEDNNDHNTVTTIELTDKEINENNNQNIIETSIEPDNNPAERTEMVEKVSDVEKHIPQIRDFKIVIDPLNNTNTTTRYTENSENSVPLHKDQMILFKQDGDEEWRSAKLESRAGKAKSKWGNAWNVALQDGTKMYVNFDGEDIEYKTTIHETHFLTNDVFLTKLDNEQTIAKQKELNNWKEQKVYQEIENENQNCISVKWVISPKVINGVLSTKARLVAKGFEEDFENRVDSPTGTKEGLRLILCLITAKGWKIKSLDVKAAFLQGYPIDREIYIKPPIEANTTKLWKLTKCVYGLNDASRQWYLRLRSELIKLGATPSIHDQGIFCWFDEHHIIYGILTVFVDDIIHGGNEKFHIIITKLKSTFSFGEENEQCFKYIGINITQIGSDIFVDQLDYVRNITFIDIPPHSKKDQILNEYLKKEVRSRNGQLNWLSTVSRPELSFHTCVASGLVKNSTIKDINFVNKIIKQAKNTQYKIRFRSLDFTKLKIVVYTDASYNNLPNGGSQGSYFIWLSDGNFCVPITWRSTRIKKVVRSTLAAETIALADGCDAAYSVKSLICEIFGISENLATHIYTDNESLYNTANTCRRIEDRVVRVDLSAIRQQISENKIILHWIDSKNQLADCLTKIGASNELLIQTLLNGSHISKNFH